MTINFRTQKMKKEQHSMFLRKSLQCSTAATAAIRTRDELKAKQCPKEDTVTFLVFSYFPSRTLCLPSQIEK